MPERPKLEWNEDKENRTWEVRYEGALVWIVKRPWYCDRGHWSAAIDAPFQWNVDEQDGFPRYYMDLEVAKKEIGEWLIWRVECLKRHG